MSSWRYAKWMNNFKTKETPTQNLNLMFLIQQAWTKSELLKTTDFQKISYRWMVKLILAFK